MVVSFFSRLVRTGSVLNQEPKFTNKLPGRSNIQFNFLSNANKSGFCVSFYKANAVLVVYGHLSLVGVEIKTRGY